MPFNRRMDKENVVQKWMELDRVILSEVAQEDKHGMYSFISGY